MTPDVAVVIPLKLVYTPVDDDVTALICSQSQSQSTVVPRGALPVEILVIDSLHFKL